MPDCIFCKIARLEIDAIKIRENDDFIAILDVFPNRRGMTIVFPKKHYNSDLTEVSNSVLSKWIIAAKEVMKLLKEKLWVPRVGLVIEWLEVNHLHFKLYPFRDNIWFSDGVWSGPRADNRELEKLAETLTNNNGYD